MAEAAVSQGALRNIYAGQKIENPILQCVYVKALNNTAAERYRCVFSDVQNFMQSMLGSQLNHLVKEDKLKRGVFVRVTQYQVSEAKGKTIMVVLDCEVLEELGECEKLGDPQSLDNSTSEVKQEQEETAQPNAISSNNFYGSKPQASAKPQTKPSGSSAYSSITPIDILTPYQHKWTIKARCVNKSDIKTWHNKNGEGKLFSVTFLDDSSEIRGTAFNEQCDALYDVFQEGSVYYISTPCRVQLAKKQFSNVNNDYELTFERDTQVEKAEEASDVPQVRYNFQNVADLQNVEKDTTIDIIAVLKDVGEVNQITSKTTSKPYDKRELTLVDNTGYSVRLTIWGNAAQSFDVKEESVIAFKGVKVSDFGGRSLSLLSSGSMSVDPDIDEAHKLKGWYDTQGRSENYASHAAVMGTTGAGGRKDQFKTIAAVKDEQLGMSEQADYFTLKATVIYVKSENIAYPACRTEQCNKKVIELQPGEWRCEKCNMSFEQPHYRYIMQANVSDHTGQLWVSCFDETGRMLMGMDANELMALKEESDDKLYTNKISDANCQTWVFRCRAKMDTFQDQQRVRYQVSSAAPVNFAQEANRLAELIKQYDIGGDSLFVS